MYTYTYLGHAAHCCVPAGNWKLFTIIFPMFLYLETNGHILDYLASKIILRSHYSENWVPVSFSFLDHNTGMLFQVQYMNFFHESAMIV